MGFLFKRHPRTRELKYLIAFLKSNVTSTREFLLTRTDDLALKGVRYTLYNIINALASIYSEEKFRGSPPYLLADYYDDYHLLGPGDDYIWDQAEWQRLAREKTPRLAEFANLSPRNPAIQSVFKAIELEHWRFMHVPYEIKKSASDFGPPHYKIITEACAGLEYLVDMVERHANWVLRQT